MEGSQATKLASQRPGKASSNQRSFHITLQKSPQNRQISTQHSGFFLFNIELFPSTKEILPNTQEMLDIPETQSSLQGEFPNPGQLKNFWLANIDWQCLRILMNNNHDQYNMEGTDYQNVAVLWSCKKILIIRISLCFIHTKFKFMQFYWGFLLHKKKKNIVHILRALWHFLRHRWHFPLIFSFSHFLAQTCHT